MTDHPDEPMQTRQQMLEHIPAMDMIILGGWIEDQKKDGKISVEPKQVQDVLTGIRLAMHWYEGVPR